MSLVGIPARVEVTVSDRDWAHVQLSGPSPQYAISRCRSWYISDRDLGLVFFKLSHGDFPARRGE